MVFVALWCVHPFPKRAGPALPWGFFEHFFVDAPSTVASRSASTTKKDGPMRPAERLLLPGRVGCSRLEEA